MKQTHLRLLLLQGKTAAVLVLFVIVLLPVAAVPAAAETPVSMGIQTGAAHACPDGCSCMPAGQAERLGLARCSAVPAPCFHDSLGQPLYCYHQRPAAPCLSACNGSAGAPVAPVTTVSGQNTSQKTDNGSAAFGAVATATPAPVQGLLSPLAGFFRWLFGIR